MIRFFFLNLLCISLASVTFAGTPPVKQLKLLSESKVIEMYANNSITEIEIGTYGESGSAVIPSEWYCEPKLPDGLEIVRGEGSDNVKLYIKGIPAKAKEYQQYTIFALNNGNKVKKIDAAFVILDIIVHEENEVLFTYDFEADKINKFNMSNYQMESSIESYRYSNQALGKNYKLGYSTSYGGDETEFFIKDIKTGQTNKVNILGHLLLFNGKNFIIWNEKNRVIYEVDINGTLINQYHQNDFFYNRYNIYIFLHDYYICFQKKKSDSIYEYSSIEIYDRSFQKVQKLIKNVPFDKIGYGENTLFLGTKDTSSIEIFSIKELSVIRTIDIPHFKIVGNKITHINNNLLIIGFDPFYREYFILKIKENNEILPFRVGIIEPVKIEYCNGFMCVIFHKKIQILNYKTNEMAYERAFTDTISETTIINNHLVVVTNNRGAVLFDLSHIAINYEPRTINNVSSLLKYKSKENQVLPIFNDKNTVFIRTSDAQVQQEIKGKYAFETDKVIAATTENELYLYAKKSFNLLENKNFPDNVINATYCKESKNCIVYTSQEVFVMRTEDNFHIDKIQIRKTSNEKIYYVALHEDNIVIITNQNIQFINILTNHTNNFLLPYEISDRSFIFAQSKEKCCFSSALAGDSYPTKNPYFLLDIQKHQVVFSFSDMNDTPNHITHINFTNDNKVVILHRKPRYGQTIKNIFTIIDFTEPSKTKDGGEISGILSSPYGPKNNRILMKLRELLIFNLKNKQKTYFPNINYKNCFFSNNKFFLLQRDGTIIVIDTIHDKLLGTFETSLNFNFD